MTSVEYHIIRIESEISGGQNELEDLDIFFNAQNTSETETTEFVQIDRSAVEDDEEWGDGSERLRQRLLSYMDTEGRDHAIVMRTHYY